MSEKNPMSGLKTYKFPPNWTCLKSNCVYRSSTGMRNTNQTGKCNYIGLTGHSRIAKLPEGEARWPSNCPYYKKRVREKACK